MPRRRAHLPWAELLERTFQVDVLDRHRCGGRMKLVALLKDPDITLKKPYRNKTTAVELAPHAFMARLATLVPAPRLFLAMLLLVPSVMASIAWGIIFVRQRSRGPARRG